MSHQMLTSTLEGVVKHPLFQRDRFGEMGLPRMAQRAVVSHHPIMRRVDSLEKTLKLGGIGGRMEGDDRG